MRKFKPTLSLRISFYLVMFACIYCACWWPTKEYAKSVVDTTGTKAIQSSWANLILYYPYVHDARAVAPLVIAQWETDIDEMNVPYNVIRRYVWAFGLKIKLPVETQWVTLPLSK